MAKPKISRIESRIEESSEAVLSATPPFPRQISVELNNVCNHACSFCAYTLMERMHGNIRVEKLEQWLREAYDLGAREIGLHAGAEPFASRHLEHFTGFCRQMGYEYIYISTNGSLATPQRMKEVIDAGMHSIKFSVNGGDRESYRKTHGKDDFDLVLKHIRYASEYRGKAKIPYLVISFVKTDLNRDTEENLRKLTEPWVDEFVSFEASNQNGQMPGKGTWIPATKENACAIPFNKLYISWEGFLRVCCNDYENLLAIEDLNLTPLKEAYYSQRFQEFRRRHIENRLEGTLCHNCKKDCAEPVQPLNAELYFRSHKTDEGPPISHSEKVFGQPALRS